MVQSNKPAVARPRSGPRSYARITQVGLFRRMLLPA